MTRETLLIIDIALLSMMSIAFVHTNAVAVLIGLTASSALLAIAVNR